MSDYTPHIGEIRDAVSGGWDYAYIAPAEFDRWLAAHDAEVYQRGREDERNEHRIQGEGQVPFVARGDGEQT